jgi:hypothetical protein
MQRMDKVCIVAEKIYIRGYQTAKKVHFEAKKLTLKQKKVYIFEEKVYNIYQKKCQMVHQM